MYLGYQDNKIKFYTENELPKKFYNLDKSVYTEDEYVLDGEEYVLKDEEWERKQAEKEQIKKIEIIKSKLKELDNKRIRAICEDEVKDEKTGQTWLEYYNIQVQALREELSSLE